MADGRKFGLASALGEAMAAVAAAPAVEIDQGELLPLPGRPAVDFSALGVAVRRGPGRPRGARNRSTIAWQNWTGQQGKMPVQWLVEFYTSDPVEIARALHCDAIDVLRLQQGAAVAAARYLHQALTPAEGAAPAPPLHVNIGVQVRQVAGSLEGGPRIGTAVGAGPTLLPSRQRDD